MKDITDEIYKSLLKLKGVPDENVFKYVVPENYHNQTKEAIIRIFPLPGTPDEYADDSEHTREYNYQIDIWDAEKEPMEYMEKIVNSLKELNFQVTYRQQMYELETLTFRELIRVTANIIL